MRESKGNQENKNNSRDSLTDLKTNKQKQKNQCIREPRKHWNILDCDIHETSGAE